MHIRAPLFACGYFSLSNGRNQRPAEPPATPHGSTTVLDTDENVGRFLALLTKSVMTGLQLLRLSPWACCSFLKGAQNIKKVSYIFTFFFFIAISLFLLLWQLKIDFEAQCRKICICKCEFAAGETDKILRVSCFSI